jgi:hypothetical protein
LISFAICCQRTSEPSEDVSVRGNSPTRKPSVAKV